MVNSPLVNGGPTGRLGWRHLRQNKAVNRSTQSRGQIEVKVFRSCPVTAVVIRLTESMRDQKQELSLDGFAPLRMAIIADIKRHVASLRQSGVEFYGYAVLPPDYYTAFDPTTLAVPFNCESDVDAANRGLPYYRYSVDEWKNYVHDGFDAVNRQLKPLLTSTRSASDDSIDDAFVNSVYQAVLDAMLTLRNENTFDGVPYLVVWLSDSGDSILNRSAKLLNAPNIYSDFAAEFGD